MIITIKLSTGKEIELTPDEFRELSTGTMQSIDVSWKGELSFNDPNMFYVNYKDEPQYCKPERLVTLK